MSHQLRDARTADQDGWSKLAVAMGNSLSRLEVIFALYFLQQCCVFAQFFSYFVFFLVISFYFFIFILALAKLFFNKQNICNVKKNTNKKKQSIHSEHCEKMKNEFVAPLEKFRDVEINEVQKLKLRYKEAKSAYDVAVAKERAAKESGQATKMQQAFARKSETESQLKGMRDEFLKSVEALERQKNTELLGLVLDYWEKYISFAKAQNNALQATPLPDDIDASNYSPAAQFATVTPGAGRPADASAFAGPEFETNYNENEAFQQRGASGSGSDEKDNSNNNDNIINNNYSEIDHNQNEYDDYNNNNNDNNNIMNNEYGNDYGNEYGNNGYNDENDGYGNNTNENGGYGNDGYNENENDANGGFDDNNGYNNENDNYNNIDINNEDNNNQASMNPFDDNYNDAGENDNGASGAAASGMGGPGGDDPYDFDPYQQQNGASGGGQY